MIDNVEYSIDFHREPPRGYMVGDRIVYPSSDYTSSQDGKMMFEEMKLLINKETKAARGAASSVEQEAHFLVARSLAFTARRFVVEWEGAAAQMDDGTDIGKLQTEQSYCQRMIGWFSQEKIDAIIDVNGRSVEDFYKNVAGASADAVSTQVAAATGLHEIMTRLKERYDPLLSDRAQSISAELESANAETADNAFRR